MRNLKGIPVSKGIAISTNFVYQPEKPKIKEWKVKNTKNDIDRFKMAVEKYNNVIRR